MHTLLPRGLRAAVFGATLAAFALPASAADITLKLSHFLPDKHGIHQDFLAPWAKELEEKTGGKVAVEIYPVNTAFGNVAKQMDQVRAGVVDIAHGLAGIPRGRMPRTSVMDLPFLVQDAGTATHTIWDLYKEGLLKGDYQGVKPLALHCHNAGLIHTVNTPVRLPADVKGLRLRTPSPATSAMIQDLGGTPVGMPPTEVYENLQKGVLDGTIFTWDAAAAFRLNEVVKYHTDARAYTTCFYFVMNQRTYDGLPADVRQAVDSISGDALIPKFGPWWDKWDQRGLDEAKANGHEIISLTAAERAEWQKALQPTIAEWLKRLKADEGVDNAQAIYDRAQELVQKYETQ